MSEVRSASSGSSKKGGRGTHPNSKKTQFKKGHITWNKGMLNSNRGNKHPKAQWTAEFLRRNKEELKEFLDYLEKLDIDG